LVSLFVMESKDPADALLREILSKPITDEKIVAETLIALRNHDAMTKSRALVEQYADSSRTLLEKLPEGAAKQALVALCETVINRSA
jgi:heptaprenyl diphosphate synthase